MKILVVLAFFRLLDGSVHHLDTESTIWKPNYFVYYWYNFLRKNMICSLFFSTSGKTYYIQSNFSLKIAQFDVEDPVLDVSPWKCYCIHTSTHQKCHSRSRPENHVGIIRHRLPTKPTDTSLNVSGNDGLSYSYVWIFIFIGEVLEEKKEEKKN